MATPMTDSELGRILLSLRGFQWIIGTKGDPYALLLRAASDDPHELGRRIRRRGPLYRSSAGVWVTATHSVAQTALRAVELSPRPAPPDPPVEAAESVGTAADPLPWEVPTLREVLPLEEAFLNMSRSDQDRIRAGVAAAFATVVEHHDGEAADRCRDLLRARTAGFDLMTRFARPAATASLGALLGVPAQDHHRLVALCERTACALDAVLCPPRLTTARELLSALEETRSICAGMLSGGPAAGPNLLAAMARTEAEPDLLATAMLTLTAGIEATANLICETTAALLDHPEVWKAVRADPALAPAAVEETLRYAPPVRLQRLFALGDLELAGQPVEAHAEVVVAIQAAERDPDVRPDSDLFDPRREFENPPLSITGVGDASVLAPLIRWSAATAVRTLATELTGLHRTGAVLRRLRSPVTGGVLQFPVEAELDKARGVPAVAAPAMAPHR
jgi:P450-derived glycosyltransferase activator